MRESPHEPWRRCEGQPSPSQDTDEWRAPPVPGLCSGETETDPALRKLRVWEGRHKEGGKCNLMAGASAAILALGGKFASSH